MDILKSIYAKNRFKQYFYLILGVLIYACAYNVFILPNDIVFGGIGGISIIANHFLGVRPSIFMFGCSFVFCLFGFVFLPREQVFRSVIGSILLPIFVEATSFLSDVIVFENVDMLVVSLFGGIFVGIGVGIVYKYGLALGGTDFLIQIINRYFKFTMGTSRIIVEGVIVIIGAFVFGVTNFLYAIIILYLESFFSDKMILGISDKKAFYIITSKRDEVSDYVISTLGHTITQFSATGGFSKKKVAVLFTVIPTREYYKLKEGISLIDSEAFFTAIDAYEVSGGE